MCNCPRRYAIALIDVQLAYFSWTQNGSIEDVQSGTRLGYQSDRSHTVSSSVGKRLYCFAIWFVLLAGSTVICQEPQTANSQQVSRPLHMLVLGDSILWGQGLKAENKPVYHVKIWLEKCTGRRVVERIEAHSGAVIEGTSLSDTHASSNPEVNLGSPTINDQLDSAIRFYADTSQVALVLISGCGNDVGVQNLLSALNSGEVDNMTQEKCGKPVENLLRRITTAFPSAQVINWLLSILLAGNPKRFRAEGSRSPIF
jgi:hypothetical protein